MQQVSVHSLHQSARSPARVPSLRKEMRWSHSVNCLGQTQNAEKQQERAGDAGWLEKLFPGEILKREKKREAERENSIQHIHSLVSQLEDATRDAGEADYRRTKALKPRNTNKNEASDAVSADPLSFLAILEQLPNSKAQQPTEKVILELDFLDSDPEQVVSDSVVAEVAEGGSKQSDDAVSSGPSKLTVQDLKAVAKAKGLSGYSKLRKEDLLQLLGLDG